MHIDTINTYAEFENLRPQWELVYSEDEEAQFFLSWVWLSQLFVRRPDSWSVLAARSSDDDYVAFLPLRPTTRFSRSAGRYVNEMFMAGNFWADFTGLICKPGYELTAIPTLMHELQKLRWSKVDFENIRMSDRRLALLKTQFSTESFRISSRKRTSKVDGINNLISPVLALPDDFQTYLQNQVSNNTRQKIRRYQRKLLSLEDLEIVESTDRTREEDLDALVGFWRQRWADRKGKKVATLARKYREIVYQGLEAGIIYMPVLRANDRPVMVLASFVDEVKRCLLFFVAGRDTSWHTLPAGLLLHAHSIQWAIERGIRTYELLRGDEQYKYSLGAQDRTVACIRVEPRSARNLGNKLAAESRDFILHDLDRQISKGNQKVRKNICLQVLENWPNDTDLLQRCRSLLLQAGSTEIAELISQESLK